MATLMISEELAGLGSPDQPADLKSRLLAYERDLITAALAETRGNQRRAARQLGILPTTLHEKMKRLGLRAAVFLPGGAAASAARGAEPSF